MSIEQIKAQDNETTSWSGGETRQMLIYPEGASYADRNFDFRLSSATVSVDQTTFTDFTGYRRFIQILSGEMRLQHDDGQAYNLKRHDYSYFNGEQLTRSFGQCVDFNLIYRPQYRLKNDNMSDNSLSFGRHNMVIIYALYPGQLSVVTPEATQTFLLGQGDVLFIQAEKGECIPQVSKEQLGETRYLTLTLTPLI